MPAWLLKIIIFWLKWRVARLEEIYRDYARESDRCTCHPDRDRIWESYSSYGYGNLIVKIKSQLKSLQKKLEKKQMPGKSIAELKLSIRTTNLLRGIGIKTISDLIKKSERDLQMTKNFGRKSIKEIVDALKGINLTLRRRT